MKVYFNTRTQARNFANRANGNYRPVDDKARAEQNPNGRRWAAERVA